ncbi:MAG: TraI domain-containing protein [Chromatiaceae bacterium]|nr:TraI domain-containing protein [Chromatiaceae bacterium]MCF7994346.1 TraI domain-containing protein [Chromatiaceae bacterium]MCF8016458.1 TraI domain-containing protein [Chromatiaceae bacterium]
MNRLVAWCLGTDEALKPPQPSLAAAPQTPAPEPVDLEEIPRYPPFARGLPVATVEQLLESQSELIERLKQQLGLGDDDDGTPRWATYIEPVICRYAAFVHLLPASEAHHHCGSGGLLRHGLEVAFRATMLSQGVLVARDRPREQQLQIEPRFASAAALAGLLHDAGKAIADVSATDRDGQLTWSPFQSDLLDWASRHGLRRYFLHWRAGRAGDHEPFSLAALRRILPGHIDAWLSTPDPRVYVGFLSAITQVPHPSPLVDLVRRADRSSVEQDLKTHRIAPLETAVGVPVERYLIDGMRRLLHEGRWQVNVPGARVWLLREGGLHLVWPAAARDLTERLAADHLPGIPRDPDTLAELLLERGLVVVPTDPNVPGPTWRLAPAPLARQDGTPVWLHLLRLNDPSLLFPFGAPPTVDVMSTTQTVSTPVPAVQDAMQETREADPQQEITEEVAAAEPNAEAAQEVAVVHTADVAPVSAVQAESPEPEPEPEPEPAQVAAETRLRALLKQSADLMDHLDQLGAADGETAIWRDGLYWLRYPDWFATVGWSPRVAAEALSADGLIESDPATPMRRVRDHAGARWIVLSPVCSEALRAWLDALPSELPTERPVQVSAEVPERPAEPSPEASTSLDACQTSPTRPPPPAPRVGVESLHPQVVERLILELRPAQGQRERRLSRAALQTLAKQRGFGVYRLRDALLRDERVRAEGLDLLIREERSS